MDNCIFCKIAAFAGVDGVLDLGEDGVGHGIFGFEG